MGYAIDSRTTSSTNRMCFYHLLYPPKINRLRGGEFSVYCIVLPYFTIRSLGPLIIDILQNIGNLKSNNGKGEKLNYTRVYVKYFNASLQNRSFFLLFFKAWYHYCCYSIISWCELCSPAIICQCIIFRCLWTKFVFLKRAEYRFYILHLDDNTYAIQLEYLNMTYGRNAHVVRLPGNVRMRTVFHTRNMI